MVHRKNGKIVFVSSVAGKVPIPFRSSYAASKHALQAFSDSLRAEVAMYNIKVLVSSPEYIAVDLSDEDIYRAGTPNEGKYRQIQKTAVETPIKIPIAIAILQWPRRMHRHWAIRRRISPKNCSCRCCAMTRKIHRLPSNSLIGFVSRAQHSSIGWCRDVPNKR